ncbi:MAG: AmmeMemoRadiSam system radical SAM enzyme [Thermococci archaeon]|nr:AmmeMemoRadiSam system radical SAM enzyme [Thermococci archaeon]
MREASFWEPLDSGRVRCNLCPVRCIINEGRRGSCRVRVNVGGRLYTLNYGKVTSMALDPVEKKPLFHFWPGSCAFSVGTFGCNMHCRHCQNWEISQADESFPYVYDVTPEELVETAKRKGCELIAYTYNEPVIWYEFVKDTAEIARKAGLKNVLVTNGYINEEPFRELAPLIDAMNIDIKAWSDDFYRRIARVPGGEASRRTAVLAKREFGIHVELTYLIIPTLNDDPEEIKRFLRWVIDELGRDTPVHFSRFFPHYELIHLPPTPINTVEAAYRMAKEMGLPYVYVGNIPGHEGENTYCPRCGKPVIVRRGFEIIESHVKDGKCAHCGEEIPIVGEVKRGGRWWF